MKYLLIIISYSSVKMFIEVTPEFIYKYEISTTLNQMNSYHIIDRFNNQFFSYSCYENIETFNQGELLNEKNQGWSSAKEEVLSSEIKNDKKLGEYLEINLLRIPFEKTPITNKINKSTIKKKFANINNSYIKYFYLDNSNELDYRILVYNSYLKQEEFPFMVGTQSSTGFTKTYRFEEKEISQDYYEGITSKIEHVIENLER